MKNLFTDVEYKIASIFFAIMLVLVLLSIGMRLFGGGLVWAEELARYAVVWGVCLGIIGGVKARHHIFIDFIIDRFPRKISFGFKLFDDIVDFCIYLFVSYYAFQFVSKTIDTGQLTPQLAVAYVGYLFSHAALFFRFCHPPADKYGSHCQNF